MSKQFQAVQLRSLNHLIRLEVALHHEAVFSARLRHAVAGDIQGVGVAVIVRLKLEQGEVTLAVGGRVKSIVVTIHGGCILRHAAHPGCAT